MAKREKAKVGRSVGRSISEQPKETNHECVDCHELIGRCFFRIFHMSVDCAGSDFKLEKTSASAKITGVHESLLQECEKDIIWYRDNFFGKSNLS